MNIVTHEIFLEDFQSNLQVRSREYYMQRNI